MSRITEVTRSSAKGDARSEKDDLYSAEDLSAAGDYDDALSNYQLAVRFLERGDARLAKIHLARTLELDPAHGDALLSLFRICWEDGSYGQGLDYLRRSLDSGDVGDSDSIKPGFELYPDRLPAAEDRRPEIRPQRPRRLVLKTAPRLKDNELFLKWVPRELRDQKSGLSIAVIAAADDSGQLPLLFKLINRYTTHKARLIDIRDRCRSCDGDLVYQENRPDQNDEIIRVLEQADFFHFESFPGIFSDPLWGKFIRPGNALIQYFGGEGQPDPAAVELHEDNEIVGLAPRYHSGFDQSHYMYQVDFMVDLTRVKRCPPPADIIRVCHPTSVRDGRKSAMFLSVIERLRPKYPVEVELIQGESPEQRLDIKSRCHLTYESDLETWSSLSAVESMAAGHVVLCDVSNHAARNLPGDPAIYVDEQTLEERIEYLLDNREEISRLGAAGRIWVAARHDPLRIIRRYLWLYDFVSHGRRSVDTPESFLLS